MNHRDICDMLEEKDFIFKDLVGFAQNNNIVFVAHERLIPGIRWWGVPIIIETDGIGRLRINEIFKVVSVPYQDIQGAEKNRKALFLKEFELSHEFGHIAVLENEDLTDWLTCSFLRLDPERRCPYFELRACEEGIKILEDIMEKYDPEIKSKEKLKKFFNRVYASQIYSRSFSQECAVSLFQLRLNLKVESSLCPVMDRLKETLLRLKEVDKVIWHDNIP